MIDEDYQPTGDARKDYMAFSELCNRTPRMDIINNIRYTLVKTPLNCEELDYNDETKTPKVEPKRILIDDFNDLDADDVDRIQSEFHIRNPSCRFTYVDVLSVGKALSHITLNFISLKLINCGLSRKCLLVLGKALSHIKTLRHLSIEMNSFERSYEESDEILASIPAVKDMNAALVFCTPSVELMKKKEEQSPPIQLQLCSKKNNAKSKKSEQQATDQENIQKQMENKVVEQTFLKHSISPIFMCSAKHVSLRGCALDDDDAEAIAEILSENHSIISLNLWGNNITDRGGSAIAKSLKTNRVLRSISLAMNKISDSTVQEMCNSLWKSYLYSEDEMTIVREKIHKSTFGTLNLQRDPTKTDAISLPPLPMHLKPIVERKKAEKAKKPNQKAAVNSNVETSLEWETMTLRLDSEDLPSSKQVQSRSESCSNVNGMKPDSRKPLFQIPGNQVIRSINLSANSMITDKGAALFLQLPYIYLDRLNLSYCNVSNDMFLSVAQKMNESPPTVDDENS